VPRQDGAPSYLLSVRPLLDPKGAPYGEPCAIVFVRDPLSYRSVDVATLREVFGLTEAEACLAKSLQAGQAPANYARERALSLNTVYTHLRRLKDKIGCSRMTELLRKLNELQVPLRPDAGDTASRATIAALTVTQSPILMTPELQQNDSNKSDNKNGENRTERAPAGHGSKPATAPTKLQQAVAATEAGKIDKGGNNQAHKDKFAPEPAGHAGKPATASAKSQPAAKLMDLDTSHMGVASKQTETAAAKARQTAPLTKFDTSHLGTSSNSTKPAPAPASTQQPGKLTAFDTSHMRVATKLQSFSKPVASTAAKTLANQH
jgi:DNA-binding CsgD family transcriptional regulator